jgi:hypothetical protein
MSRRGETPLLRPARQTVHAVSHAKRAPTIAVGSTLKLGCARGDERAARHGRCQVPLLRAERRCARASPAKLARAARPDRVQLRVVNRRAAASATEPVSSWSDPGGLVFEGGGGCGCAREQASQLPNNGCTRERAHGVQRTSLASVATRRAPPRFARHSQVVRESSPGSRAFLGGDTEVVSAPRPLRRVNLARRTRPDSCWDDAGVAVVEVTARRGCRVRVCVAELPNDVRVAQRARASERTHLSSLCVARVRTRPDSRSEIDNCDVVSIELPMPIV